MFYSFRQLIESLALPQFWGSLFLYTVLAWLIVLGLYQLLIEILRHIFIHTKTQLDDLILSILRVPVRVLIIAYGFLDVIRSFELPAGWFENLSRFDNVVLIGVTTNIVWKILSKVVLQITKRNAKESESAVDDVIVPIMGTFGQIAVVLFVTLATLNVFGIDLTTLLGVLGGLSFLLIFLFQEPLSNLFSGVYLWIDNPFGLGDLLITDDGTTYQVRRIGSRVSQLYNLNDYTVAHIPNNSLAAQRLVNITQPNMELKATVNIGVAYGTDTKKVEELLLDIANSHPNTLGKLEKKQAAIEVLIESSENKDWIKIQLERLQCEYEARNLGELISRELNLIRDFVNAIEGDGLNDKEKKAVQQHILHVIAQVKDLRRLYTQRLAVIGYLGAHYKNEEGVRFDEYLDLKAQIDKGEITWLAECIEKDDDAKFEMTKGGIIPAFKDFFNTDNAIEDLSPSQLEKLALKWKDEQPSSTVIEDFENLYAMWYRSFRHLQEELRKLTKLHKLPLEEQTQVDDKIDELVSWFNKRFLLAVQNSQLPDVSFVNHGASSLDFKLECFIDDLSGDHYQRLDDVTSDIRFEITKRFEANNIEIPFPQTDIRFRTTLESRSTNK